MASRKEGMHNYGKALTKAVGQGKDVINAIVNPNPISLFNGVKSLVQSFGTAFEGIKALKDIIFNHPEWYENYDTKGMISLNFGLNKGLTNTVSSFSNEPSTPSLAATLVLTPVVPDNASHDFDTGINIIYNRLRSANSGSVNYDINALKAYILHLNQCHAYYAILRRLYATLNNVNPYDSTVPHVLIRASGFEYDNITQFSAQIREFGAKFALKLANSGPGHLNLFDRTRWLYSNYFADSNDVKASYYCFVPDRILSFDYSSTVVNQNLLDLGNVDATAIFNIGNTLMDTLIQTRVYNIIAGDMLKAFGAEAIYQPEVWDIDMPTPIIYDEAALTQIQNAMICGGDATYSLTSTSCTSTYTGNGNLIVDAPDAVNYITDYLTRTRPVNFYKDNATPGEIMSATSLSPAVSATVELSALPTFTVTASGAEILTRILGWTRNNDGIVNELVISDPSFEAGTGDIMQFAMIATLWSNMDYMPYIGIPVKGTNTNSGPLGHMFDWNTYALANTYQLDNLRGFASMSLIAVPFVIKQVNMETVNIKSSKAGSKGKKNKNRNKDAKSDSKDASSATKAESK